MRWSPDGQLLAVASDRTLWLYSTVGEDPFFLLAVHDYGTRGQLAWSPCGAVLVVPAEDRMAVVSREGVLLRVVPAPGSYPVRYASWHPLDFAQLVVTGYDFITDTSGMYGVFSGARYRVEASPPVQEVCYLGTCAESLVVSAWERPTNITLLVEADSLTGDRARPVQVTLQLWPMPFQTLTLDASKAITTPAFNVTVEGGNSLVSVLRPPEATLTVQTEETVKTVEGIAVVLPPGAYTLTLSLEEPSNYLGPDWVLVKRFDIVLAPGQVKVYNYSWFSLENVTGTLQVETEPGSTLKLIWPNTTVETVVEPGSATYTVPAGDYTLSITLPVTDNVLVASGDILEKTTPIQVFPGDTLRVSFTYLDVLGLLVVEGPQASTVTIQGPQGITLDTTLEETQATYHAQPGQYTITLTPQKPPHWVGPQPPRAQLTVEVAQGAEAVANFFYIGEILRFIQLVEQAANITITAPPGYIVQVDYNGTTYRFSVGEQGQLWLQAPPGNLTVSLVDPQQNIALDEEKTTITGTGQISIELTLPQNNQPGQPVYAPPPEEHQGRRTLMIIAAIAIPLAIGITAYIILSRRAKTPF